MSRSYKLAPALTAPRVDIPNVDQSISVLENRVTLEVRALATLNLDGVRKAWCLRYGPPPKTRSVDLLRRLLAWRIQAEAFGGLDDRTLAALQRRGTPRPMLGLVPGTRLARQWRGARYEVEVVEEGVVYRGATYQSLSEIARVITGVRWNGPRFFGLRPAP